MIIIDLISILNTWSPRFWTTLSYSLAYWYLAPVPAYICTVEYSRYCSEDKDQRNEQYQFASSFHHRCVCRLSGVMVCTHCRWRRKDHNYIILTNTFSALTRMWLFLVPLYIAGIIDKDRDICWVRVSAISSISYLKSCCALVTNLIKWTLTACVGVFPIYHGHKTALHWI